MTVRNIWIGPPWIISDMEYVEGDEIPVLSEEDMEFFRKMGYIQATDVGEED